MSKSYTGIYNYRNVLKRCTTRFQCPLCETSILPKFFEKHCSTDHGINPKTTCVWCRRYSWPSGKKKTHSDHLIKCFRDFAKPKARKLKVESYRLASLKHAHLEKDFFGQDCNFTDELSRRSECDSIKPLEAEPPRITFQDDNLNLAAAYLCEYLKTRDTHDWLHVMVKYVAFESFASAMKEDRGFSKTLEFSCWCDGGTHSLNRYRQHRHAIVVCSPKDRFLREIWPLVKPSDRPSSKFNCKVLKKMVSPRHLINTMGYLCGRKSRCAFSTEKKGPERDKHFYLFKTLPECHRLALSLLWEGGLYEFMYQEKFQNVSIERVVEAPLTRSADGKWEQKIKDFYGHERGIVLPVSRNLVPANRVTPHFFHLMKGEKLYFELSTEDPDRDRWLRTQAKGGNCFYDVVEEHAWTPRKRDQHFLNIHMPAVIENRNLNAEIGLLKETVRRLESENALLKEQKVELEMAFLKERLQKAESENTFLKEENSLLKVKLQRVESQNAFFKEQNAEREIAFLKERLQKAESENLKEKPHNQININGATTFNVGDQS